MNSSRTNSRSTMRRASLANSGELFTYVPAPEPGSLNDEYLIRGHVSAAIKASGKSRAQIAEEMSELLGTIVTKRSLDSYTADSAEQNRWPAQYTRAFCYVTGDSSLIRCVSERAGLHLITKSERKLLELGRQILIQKRAAEEIARLEEELAEVAL